MSTATTTTQDPLVDAENAPVARVRRYGLRDRLVTLGSVIVLLVVWEIVGRSLNPILAAPPSRVFTALVEMAQDGTLGEAVGATAKPFLSGYALAAVAGIPIGLLIGRFRVVEAAIGWLVVAGYSLPMIALTPVFVLWFGLEDTVKTAIVMTMTVFAVIINTWNGVQAIPRTLTEVGTAFCAPQRMILRSIVLPSVIPSIMTGLRIGVGKAVIGIVIAEFFTALGGLGGVIVEAGHTFEPDRMFAAVVVLMAGALILTWLIGVAERRIAPWNKAITGRGDGA
ncbi:ABC transporter permease [Saccharopolyspora sp. K220]|uniref:ABC transporter permease n=1 Tax=Saccharopolyspora soli TaxID=2926618 RepID=UPI001F59E19B|nr:ABC transporter permease [Saccharopolyspora soli]MCI2417401.1 ABC transporter permease [Saccharopolyspora soli]